MEIKRNILLKLEYNGLAFSGWQIQNELRTVQSEIITSLEKFLDHEISLTGAGRTDTGVHARGQYANFYTSRNIPTEIIMHKLNRMLPKDIAVLACCEVDNGFNSRKNAISRTYNYIIFENPSALSQGSAWVIGRPLNLKTLQSLSTIVSRSNHFYNFCKIKSRKLNNDCKISSASWKRADSRLIFKISADRFLHNMVRLLVGSMVAVLDNRLPLIKFEKMFNEDQDDKARFIAPPYGLYLINVKYKGIKL